MTDGHYELLQILQIMKNITKIGIKYDTVIFVYHVVGPEQEGYHKPLERENTHNHSPILLQSILVY